MIIAVNIDFWSHGYNQQVTMGILNYAREHPGVQLFLGDTQMILSPETVPRVDGGIGAFTSGKLNPGTLPVVNVYGSDKSAQPHVGPDNRAVARMAFEHFRSRGLRQLAVLDIPKFHDFRSEPFVEICREDGFIPRIFPVGDWPDAAVLPSERTRLLRELRKLPKPAGLFLPLDAAYHPILELCRELKIRVPEDLALLGVNNDSTLCLKSSPTLSSIDLGADRIGYAAMESLVAMINGESVPDAPPPPPPHHPPPPPPRPPTNLERVLL